MTKNECQNLIEEREQLRCKEREAHMFDLPKKTASSAINTEDLKLRDIEEKLKKECAECLEELDSKYQNILRSLLSQ